MEKHQVYFNLLEALKEKGCSICFLVKKGIHKAMDDFLYERVNDPGIREEIRESLGYCATHAWQLQKFGDGFGLSIIYEDLIGILKAKMEGLASHKEKNIPDDFMRGLLKSNMKLSYHEKTKLTCPICKDSKDIEMRYISSFIDYFNDPEINRDYQSSFGFCLPHFVSTIRACKDKEIIKRLAKIEIEKLEFLRQELVEFQRKNDYRFFHEDFGKEGNSWIRAIEKMVGKEGVF